MGIKCRNSGIEFWVIWKHSVKQLYIALVRSHLSYCSPIWRPHLIKDIVSLERIQSRAMKFILGTHALHYRDNFIPYVYIHRIKRAARDHCGQPVMRKVVLAKTCPPRPVLPAKIGPRTNYGCQNWSLPPDNFWQPKLVLPCYKWSRGGPILVAKSGPRDQFWLPIVVLGTGFGSHNWSCGV